MLTMGTFTFTLVHCSVSGLELFLLDQELTSYLLVVVVVLLLLVGGNCLQKSPRLCGFKSDQDEVWWEGSAFCKYTFNQSIKNLKHAICRYRVLFVGAAGH